MRVLEGMCRRWGGAGALGAPGAPVAVLVILVVTAGYALGAAASTPFTWGANILIGIPIVVATVLAIVRWPARPDRRVALLGDARPRHPYLGWVVLLGVVVAWELFEYLARGSRSAHPTLSSMADAFDRHYLAKALAVFAWLWLGAAIVRAGAQGVRGAKRARPQ